MVDPERLLEVSSYKSPHDVFAFEILGLKFNVVYTPKLVNALFQKPATHANTTLGNWLFLTRVFGANKKRKNTYLISRNEAHAYATNDRLRNLLLSSALKSMQEHVPNLVSFASSIVDQSFWERSGFPTDISEASVSNGTPNAVEVNLFSLVRNFVGYITVSTLMGSDLMELYPRVLEDIWDLNNGFKYLLLGVPRWIPIPSLTRAHIARFNLLIGMKAFHQAIDRLATGSELDLPWRDVSDVSELMKETSSIWRFYAAPPDVKAPCDLSLLSTATIEAQALVFWTLVHLWNTPELVDQVRSETAAFAKGSQQPEQCGFTEAPRLQLTVENGLSRSCPLLKACYYECLRLYSTSMAIISIEEDFALSEILKEPHSGMRRNPFSMKAGRFAVVPLSVHYHDSRFFESPSEFRPERFLNSARDGQERQTFDGTPLLIEGKGLFFCPTRFRLENEILAFVAGILALWDFDPADSKGWSLPGRKQSIGVALPSTDIRVRLRRRRLS
ncbi:hypothetical protein MMC22_000074 [Lobaria immixta]|nr:hypothetical protein [Lobaria immixta]